MSPAAGGPGTAGVGYRARDRYAQCDETCTVDCGACKGAGRPASPPITWPELVDRTADLRAPTDPEACTWDVCINCGGPEVTTRGLILEDGACGALRRIAWCERVSCDVDRAQTDYLPTPRADGSR